jgi:hypothetical protein
VQQILQMTLVPRMVLLRMHAPKIAGAVMLRSILLLVCVFVLNACEITQVKGQIGGAKVDVRKQGGDSGHDEGRFCPPGHAKKGQC